METNNNNLFQLLQQGFRITIGATASLLETLQDPYQREISLSELQIQLNQRTTEWAEKGKITEEEARRLIEEWLFQQRSQTPSPARDNSQTTTSSTSVSNPDSQAQIRELTEQILALRTELEQLRQSKERD